MPPNAAHNVSAGGEEVAWAEIGDRLSAAVGKPSMDSEFSMRDFRTVKALGSGDMGNVFLVAQRSNNAPYAMKVMRKDVLRARRNGHRAQTERDILSAVNHPFLPVLHSHFEDEGHTFLVMNYCHGGDLNVLRHKQPEKRFSESACRFYIAEVVLALEYLHKRNIVYRDLKPENILIQPDGHLMLTDFDLSVDLSERKWTKPVKSVRDSSSPRVKKNEKKSKVNHVKAFFACGSPMSLAKKANSKKAPKSRVSPEVVHSGRMRDSEGPATSFVGTEEYVAPEIVWGKGHGLPVDWWTLGILLYELYYGKTPFKGVNRKETFYGVLCKMVTYPGHPNSLTDLIKALLVKDPEERLGTVGGAEEIKKHPFFDGVDWAELEHLSRTPVVPEPFSWEQIEQDMKAKAEATGREVQTMWSFSESSESPSAKTRDDTATVSPSGPLSLKSNGSSYRERLADSLITEHFSRAESYVSTPRDYSLDDDVSSDGTRSERKSEAHNLSTSTTPKEVRLDEGVLADLRLFDDVF